MNAGRRELKIQSLDDRLLEIDKLIIITSSDGCKLIQNSAPTSDIDSLTGFLQELFKRREMILWEMRKAGSTMSESYSRLRQKGEM